MNNRHVRVRFAPSPTGLMHLGNVRTALMNYLFARHYNGTFIIRIEDTDAQRNFDPGATHILQDLHWLNLPYQEGPICGGPHAPYFQSQRTDLYKEKLTILQEKGLAYRCFCTAEELDKKRKRQLMLKLPPRYDRTCLSFSSEQIKQKLDAQVPFIWRMRVPHNQHLTLHDLAHGAITFNLNDFSDFALTRQDGSVTFIFANFVDDMLMEITHVLRGEDHLTNTVSQLVLYHAFNAPIPVFWHLPILFNSEGKKLSKRDFGFSLNDLRAAGYVPEALCNYLGILGASFEEELMSLQQLAHAVNVEHPKAPGQIKYDVAKLTWLNHKWIASYSIEQLQIAALPFLTAQYPAATQLTPSTLVNLLTAIRTDIQTLADVPRLLHFYFVEPIITNDMILTCTQSAQQAQAAATLIQKSLTSADTIDTFLTALKNTTTTAHGSPKVIFGLIRLALTGSSHGLTIKDLFGLLGFETARARLEKLIKHAQML